MNLTADTADRLMTFSDISHHERPNISNLSRRDPRMASMIKLINFKQGEENAKIRSSFDRLFLLHTSNELASLT